MKKYAYCLYLMLICLLCLFTTTQTENTISFFIRPYPLTTKEITQEKIERKTATPFSISKNVLKSHLKQGTNVGVVATYWGYVTLSDSIGNIVFPRHTQAPKLKLLITPMIEPIMMLDAVVHHWETLPNMPAKMYLIEQKKDTETGLLYWQVSAEELPKNRIITLDTIVLFANPDTIIVPLGVSFAYNNQQLSLPDIYSTKELNITTHAIRALTIRHFFGPLIFTEQRNNDIPYSYQRYVKDQ